MKKHYNTNDKEELRKKIMGFGEKSVRKNFFPDLQNKTEEHKHGLKLLNQISDSICFFDVDTFQIIDYNLSFADVFSNAEISVKGMMFTSILCEDDKQLVKNTLENIKNGKVEKSIKVLNYRNNFHKEKMIGETSFSLSKIGDSHFYIALIRDITERIEAEKKLKELNNELERKIEERTEKLKEINSELQQFAYVVSHDLKAPLRGISQIAYWLKNDYLDKLDTDGVDLLEMLIQRVNILDELIAGILQYSRVGRTEADKELIDLTELLDEVYTFFSTSENFELKYQLENNFIIAHKVRLEQVLQNLIDNAIRYNDKEKTIVSVESYDMGDSWKIIVRDNGPGIAKKYHDKVFQIFQTLQPKDSQSTGIGLALIKKIIEMYNGSIFIDSEVGKGTAFIINIPKS